MNRAGKGKINQAKSVTQKKAEEPIFGGGSLTPSKKGIPEGKDAEGAPEVSQTGSASDVRDVQSEDERGNRQDPSEEIPDVSPQLREWIDTRLKGLFEQYLSKGVKDSTSATSSSHVSVENDLDGNDADDPSPHPHDAEDGEDEEGELSEGSEESDDTQLSALDRDLEKLQVAFASRPPCFDRPFVESWKRRGMLDGVLGQRRKPRLGFTPSISVLPQNLAVARQKELRSCDDMSRRILKHFNDCMLRAVAIVNEFATAADSAPLNNAVNFLNAGVASFWGAVDQERLSAVRKALPPDAAAFVPLDQPEVSLLLSETQAKECNEVLHPRVNKNRRRQGALRGASASTPSSSSVASAPSFQAHPFQQRSQQQQQQQQQQQRPRQQTRAKSGNNQKSI